MKPQAKSAATLRAKAVLPWGFVARSVEYRPGYTPSLAPRLRAKRLLANCILSYGLLSSWLVVREGSHGLFIIRTSRPGRMQRFLGSFETLWRQDNERFPRTGGFSSSSRSNASVP